MKKSKRHVIALKSGNILALVAFVSLFIYSYSCSNLIKDGNGNIKGTETSGTAIAESVGIEVYDLSLYEESSEEYYAALGQMEEDWFPRSAVVIPKGPEGGDYPNAPVPIYDAYPGKEGESVDGEAYTITRTWIGDIAVGTEVILEGVVQQGEWCFVTGETIGGWSSSGWVWCYRLFIPE